MLSGTGKWRHSGDVWEKPCRLRLKNYGCEDEIG